VTRKVFYMPVQTSIYTGTGVVNTTVYTCNHTHHGVYICDRAGAFGLFVLSNLFTTWVCITGTFLQPACVCGRGLEVRRFSSLFMVSTCFCRVRLCFGRSRDRGSGFVL